MRTSVLPDRLQIEVLSPFSSADTPAFPLVARAKTQGPATCRDVEAAATTFAISINSIRCGFQLGHAFSFEGGLFGVR